MFIKILIYCLYIVQFILLNILILMFIKILMYYLHIVYIAYIFININIKIFKIKIHY